MKIDEGLKVLIQFLVGFVIIWGVATIIGGIGILFVTFIFFIIIGIPIIYGLEEMGYFHKGLDKDQ